MNNMLYRFLACITLCSSTMAADKEAAHPQANFLSFTNNTIVDVSLSIQPCNYEGRVITLPEYPEYTDKIEPKNTVSFNTTIRKTKLLKKCQKEPIYYKVIIFFSHDILGNESLIWNSSSLGHSVELAYDSDDKKYVLKKKD